MRLWCYITLHMFKSLSSVGLTTLMSWAGFFSPPEPRGSFCEMEITHTSCHCCCYLVAQSCPTATPWTVAHQAPLSMGFFRQEYWGGLPRPPPGDLPNPGIKSGSPRCRQDSLPLSHQGNPTHPGCQGLND